MEKSIYVYIKDDFTTSWSEKNFSIQEKNYEVKIHCQFYRNTASGQHEYYHFKTFDNKGQALNGNKFCLSGIECQIADGDSWTAEVAGKNHQSMILKVAVKDLENEVHELRIRSFGSRYSTIAQIVEYIKLLNEFGGTHKLAFQVFNLKRKVEDLEIARKAWQEMYSDTYEREKELAKQLEELTKNKVALT